MNLVICLILTLAALSPAPEITGTIVDYNGKLISGISISAVTVVSSQTVVIKKTVSDSEGSFNFTDLTPGVYYGLTAKTDSGCAISNAIHVSTGYTSVVRLRLVRGLCQNAFALKTTRGQVHKFAA